MNDVTRYLGLLAVLPLFTSMVAIGSIDQVFANTSTTGGYKAAGVKSYGSTGKTCGQGSCIGTIGGTEEPIDETKKTPVEGGPFAKLVSVRKASANSDGLYKVLFKAYAGDRDVIDVFVLIKSDKDKKGSEIDGISAKASSTTHALISADDPKSIKVDLLRWKSNN